MPKKSSVPKSIEAESFCLRDAKGKMRMRLYVDDDYGPVFELKDSKERSRLTIQLDKGGRPLIRLSNAKEQSALGIGTDDTGDTGFTIFHPDGKPAFSFGTRTQNNSLHASAFDQTGNVIWQSISKTDS